MGRAFGARGRGLDRTPARKAFEAAVLLLLAVCTARSASLIFYACSATAPSSLGLGAPDISAARLTTLTCLGHRALTSAVIWTVVVLLCGAALGSIAWGRTPGKTAAFALPLYRRGAVLLLAAAAGFAWFFGFSWCSSSRLF